MPTREEALAELERRKASRAVEQPTAPVMGAAPSAVSREAALAELQRRRASAQPVQPAPQSNGGGMGPVNPSVTPMGGQGEWDLSKFEALPRPTPTAASVNAENPIITEQRRQQDLAGRNFAAQQPGRMAKEQQWRDELAAMNAAGVIPFKNNGPDGPLELNQERPDVLAGRAAGAFVNSNIGVANTAAQVGLNTANAYGAAFDPAMGGAVAAQEFYRGEGDAPERLATAATQGGYAQNQQAISDIIPSLPIPAAQTPGEMGADVTGNMAALFTGWGAPVLKGGRAFSESMAAVPGLSRTLRGVGVETGENAALAYGMGAGAAPPGSDRNMAGMDVASDPLSYVSIEALRALGRLPKALNGVLPETNAAGARPGPIDTTTLEPRPPAAAAQVAPNPTNALATPSAPAQAASAAQPPVTAVPPIQRQPVPTATAQAAGVPPIQPPPPVAATANAAVPTPGAVPPAGTLTPVGNGVAVDSFNNLPVKTREGVLRALEASGMNRQQAFDAIKSLNDLPPDRANMFEFELIRRYGGPDKFPNLQANLTTMGSDFSIQTPRKGGSPQDVMNKSLLEQAQNEGDYLTRTAEQLFGEGKVATKEELDAFRTQLGGRYRTQLAETYPGMTRLRNADSKRALAQTVDAGRKNLTDYLLRPDVIEQVPPWVQDQVMMQVSDDLRWLQKDDAGLQFASKANPELSPLLTSDQTLRYSPQLWKTLVEMYPTQVGHSLQSAYRAAIDDAFSGISNAVDRTTAKKLMRLRGQSRVRANAADPNKRGFGLLHLIEEASPGYKKLRQDYGDVVGAQKAADMPDTFFRVAKDEEALADFADVFENELTPLQQNAVRNGITTQIRQALKNKTEFTQPWELGAVDRGHVPNLTAVSSQPFLEALPKAFGRDGERMADAIRLSRANVDNIQAINKNFASGTPKGLDIKANANQLYEHPAATKLNPVDNFATTMGSVGLGTAFVPGGQMVSIGLLTGAAGRALYRAYKQGKSLSPSQKEALAEWLFKPRRGTDAMPPSTPRGFSRLGYAGNVVTGAGIGATTGAMSSGGDPATTAEGAVIGALGGAARAGLRARRANASIIKPPGAPRPRGGPPRPIGGGRLGAGPAAPQITPPGSPPAQMGWFGGSKPPKPKGAPVPKAPVAAEGEGAVWYHGSPNRNIEVLKASDENAVYGPGVYVSSNAGEARKFKLPGRQDRYDTPLSPFPMTPDMLTKGIKGKLYETRIQGKGMAQPEVEARIAGRTKQLIAEKYGPSAADLVPPDGITARSVRKEAREQVQRELQAEGITHALIDQGNGKTIARVFYAEDVNIVKDGAAPSSPSTVTPFKPGPKPPVKNGGVVDKAHAGSAVAGGVYGYANPVDANGDGQITDADRLPTAAGAAFGTGVGVRIARNVAGNLLGRGANRLGSRRGVPSEIRAQGFGGRKATPANQLSGPPRAKREGPSTASRMVAGGVIGGIAGSAGSADPQTQETAAKIADNNSQRDTTLAQITEFENALKIFSNGTNKEIQEQLDKEGFDLGRWGVDGNLGDTTKAAIRGRKAELSKSLEVARTRLKELEDQDKALQQQAAYERTRPTDGQQTFRDYAPLLGGITGALGAKVIRLGGTGISKLTARSAIKKADALLNNAPIPKPKTPQDRAAIEQRAVDINEFWQRGGSNKPENMKQRLGMEPRKSVPFESKRDGTMTARPLSKVTAPADLYPDKFFGGRLGPVDALIGGSAATEAYLAGQNAEMVKEKLVAAYETAKDDPSEKNLARIQELEDQYSQAKALMMLGIGAGIGTGIGVMTSKYASRRANVPMAEQELAILRQYFANQKAPPAKGTPKPKPALPSPPLPPARPRRKP